MAALNLYRFSAWIPPDKERAENDEFSSCKGVVTCYTCSYPGFAGCSQTLCNPGISPCKFSEITPTTNNQLCFLPALLLFLNSTLSLFANSLHYFAKLGMVQRNLELKRVFPGTWRDLKLWDEAGSKPAPPAGPFPAPVSKLQNHQHSLIRAALPPHHPLSEKTENFFGSPGPRAEKFIQGVGYNKKTVWGSSLLVPGWSPPAAPHWISSSLKIHFIRCIFLYLIKHCSCFQPAPCVLHQLNPEMLPNEEDKP